MAKRVNLDDTCWGDVNKIKQTMAAARRSTMDVPALTELLARCPGIAREYGDVAEQSLRAWIRLVADGCRDVGICIETRLEQVRAGLVGATPKLDPLEELLIDRVVACWLRLHVIELLEAQPRPDEPVQFQLQRARRQESANKGYLAAIAALTTYRRFLRDLVKTAQTAASFPARRSPARGCRTSRISNPSNRMSRPA